MGSRGHRSPSDGRAEVCSDRAAGVNGNGDLTAPPPRLRVTLSARDSHAACHPCRSIVRLARSAFRWKAGVSKRLVYFTAGLELGPRVGAVPGAVAVTPSAPLGSEVSVLTAIACSGLVGSASELQVGDGAAGKR